MGKDSGRGAEWELPWWFLLCCRDGDSSVDFLYSEKEAAEAEGNPEVDSVVARLCRLRGISDEALGFSTVVDAAGKLRRDFAGRGFALVALDGRESASNSSMSEDLDASRVVSCRGAARASGRGGGARLDFFTGATDTEALSARDWALLAARSVSVTPPPNVDSALPAATVGSGLAASGSAVSGDGGGGGRTLDFLGIDTVGALDGDSDGLPTIVL